MKLKISQALEPKHKNIVTCVSWNNPEELFSCSDDHTLLKWNLLTNETLTVADLPATFFPTSINLFPKVGSTLGGNKASHDTILLTTADGRFHLISQNGRIEKSVNAHEGACLNGQWSPDGSGFLTAGEDGVLKVWSRSGLPRSVVTNAGVPIYCAIWGPMGTSLIHGQSNLLVLTRLQGNTKTLQWRAHEGLVLSVAWNFNKNIILSGGEDGVFKTWNTFGVQLSSSSKHDTPILSVSWAPSGDLFAIAGYNTLRLCDSTGWSHCLDRPASGSIQSIGWSLDSTQIAAGCSNGHVLFAHVIQRQLDWKHYICILSGRKTITLRDIANDTVEQLDFPNRIVQMAMGYDHLVAVTAKQCFIHSSVSWNTPVILDLKEGNICMIILAEKCFCLIESLSISVYNYLGRLIASPRWGSMRLDILPHNAISLGADVMAVIDQNDSKLIHLFELPTGLTVRSSTDQSMFTVSHSMAVSAVALNQAGIPGERHLAIIDFNKDLHVGSIKDNRIKFYKFAVQVGGMLWCDDAAILVALQEGRLTVFGCPKSPAFLNLTTMHRDVSDLGKNPTLITMDDGRVVVRRGDGSLLHVAISPFPAQLAKKVAANQWTKALKLCRIVKDDKLWACLAAMAWEHKELSVAEEAFGIIKQPHQLEYIQQLKNSSQFETKAIQI